jgi:hydroxymethylglutaryl-CoA lyase
MMNDRLKIIECPRDAMQGIKNFIPTAMKANYINSLLNCGFDTIDFGSFVSPKVIPQLSDTVDVLSRLQLNGGTKLLSIVANVRGAEEAVVFDEIDYLGFPFSISQEFQKRNTNATIEASFFSVEAIQQLCVKSKKKLVVYISMGFGNPYKEEWNLEIVEKWCRLLHENLDISVLALSDTIGSAQLSDVKEVYSTLVPLLPNVEFGAHFHCRPERAKEMVEAAYSAGCRRFDGAIKGYGGCPMAADDLVGNMPTELMLEWFDTMKIDTGINPTHFQDAFIQSRLVF